MLIFQLIDRTQGSIAALLLRTGAVKRLKKELMYEPIYMGWQ